MSVAGAPKVLFTSPVFAYPAAGGPALRVENSVKALSRVSELHVVCRATYGEMGGRKAVDLYRSLAARFCFAPLKGPGWSHVLTAAARRYPVLNPTVTAIVNAPVKALDAGVRAVAGPENHAAFLVDYARRNSIDIVWFGFGNISHDLMCEVARLAPQLRLICDTDSVWSRFILRQVPFEQDDARREKMRVSGEAKEREEREWTRLCDVTTAVSEVDAEYYRSFAPEKDNVKLFSNGIDLASYAADIPRPATMIEPSVYLAGTFWNGSPMEHAARWTLDEVLPAVWRELPELGFCVVGKGSKEALRDVRDPRVRVMGYCDSVLPYLRNAAVVIVPLWFESGTRFKILEAGACSKAVVSTTLGAEGLAVAHGRDILIADDPADFAAGILRVVRDRELARTLGANLMDFVSRHNSIDALAREAAAVLECLRA